MRKAQTQGSPIQRATQFWPWDSPSRMPPQGRANAPAPQELGGYHRDGPDGRKPCRWLRFFLCDCAANRQGESKAVGCRTPFSLRAAGGVGVLKTQEVKNVACAGAVDVAVT